MSKHKKTRYQFTVNLIGEGPDEYAAWDEAVDTLRSLDQDLWPEWQRVQRLPDDADHEEAETEPSDNGESKQLEHRKIDPEVCPRCGNDWTEEVGLDRDRDELEEFPPDEIRSCPECEKRESEHHEGTYALTYQKVLACVSWTDDEGVDHIVHDSDHLVREAAKDLYDVAKDVRHLLETPGDFTDHEKACILEDLEFAIRKAKGERP